MLFVLRNKADDAGSVRVIEKIAKDYRTIGTRTKTALRFVVAVCCNGLMLYVFFGFRVRVPLDAEVSHAGDELGVDVVGGDLAAGGQALRGALFRDGRGGVLLGLG